MQEKAKDQRPKMNASPSVAVVDYKCCDCEYEYEYLCFYWHVFLDQEHAAVSKTSSKCYVLQYQRVFS